MHCTTTARGLAASTHWESKSAKSADIGCVGVGEPPLQGLGRQEPVNCDTHVHGKLMRSLMLGTRPAVRHLLRSRFWRWCRPSRQSLLLFQSSRFCSSMHVLI